MRLVRFQIHLELESFQIQSRIVSELEKEESVKLLIKNQWNVSQNKLESLETPI